MGLFTPSRRVFAAFRDALQFSGDGANLTKVELGHAQPIADLQASIEAAQVRYSDFILLRTDAAGGADSTVGIDVHVLADWSEIRNRGRNLAGVAGTEVPEEHDAWIIGAGVDVTVVAAIDEAEIWFRAPTIGLGQSRQMLYVGDFSLTGPLTRNITNDSPILKPLPWPILPVGKQAHGLEFHLNTNAVVSSNLTLSVLSAPPGVFRRLY